MSSIAMQMTKKMMKEQYALQGTNRPDGSFDPMKMREASDASMLMLPPEQGVVFEPVQLGIMPGEKCTPEKHSDEAVIFYIHGGGLVAGNARTSRFYASVLANATGYTVYTASYRLAPEHKCPSMQEDCVSAYEALLALYPDTPIALVGESGGAYLSVTTSLLAKERGLRLPAAVAAYSVLIDLSGELTFTKNVETDVSLSPHALAVLADTCCPDADMRRDPIVSPLYADYAGFPPLLLAWDASEILAVHSEKLSALCQAAGVELQAKGYDDAFHAFPTLGHMIPESEEVLQNTIVFIRSHI
jgi:monoterpene epsilon-lactone hydrolase